MQNPDLVQSVRARPGMYFGPLWRLGDQCVLELAANCLDRFLAGDVKHFEIEAQGREVWIADDGNGLPFDEPSRDPLAPPEQTAATEFFTTAHFGPTRDGHAPHVHLWFTGLGLAVVAAVCERLSVQSWRNGLCWRQEFAAATPLGPPEVIDTGNGRGTAMRLQIAPELLGPYSIRPGVLRQILFQAVHLFPGVLLDYNGERFHAPGGLRDLAFLYVPDSHHQPLDKIFHARVSDSEVELEVVAICEKFADRSVTKSWMNGSETAEHGTHVDGVRAAFRGQSWKPATLLVHAVMQNPAFAGPARRKVCNPDLRSRLPRLLRPVVRAATSDWK